MSSNMSCPSQRHIKRVWLRNIQIRKIKILLPLLAPVHFNQAAYNQLSEILTTKFCFCALDQLLLSYYSQITIIFVLLNLGKCQKKKMHEKSRNQTETTRGNAPLWRPWSWASGLLFNGKIFICSIIFHNHIKVNQLQRLRKVAQVVLRMPELQLEANRANTSLFT